MAGPHINLTAYYLYLNTLTYLLPIMITYVQTKSLFQPRPPSQRKLHCLLLHHQRKQRHKSSNSRFKLKPCKPPAQQPLHKILLTIQHSLPKLKFDCCISLSFRLLWNQWSHLFHRHSPRLNTFFLFAAPGKLSSGTYL